MPMLTLYASQLRNRVSAQLSSTLLYNNLQMLFFDILFAGNWAILLLSFRSIGNTTFRIHSPYDLMWSEYTWKGCSNLIYL